MFPSTGGSSIIVNNIAKAFRKDEMVIVGEKPNRKVDKLWSNDLPSLHYIEPFALNNAKKGIKYSRWLSFFRIKKELKQLAIKEKCTAVLAIFPDEYYMHLAYSVSKELNLPFYTWFHNTYLDNRSGLKKAIAKSWQPKFFNHATHNFVMSEGMKKLYAERYPNWTFTSLVHGFEIPKTEMEPIPTPNKPIKFLFSGSINESCLDATVRLFSYIIEQPDVELHIFSGNGNLLHSLNLVNEKVIIHEFMPLSEFEKILTDYDIMLLPHGFDGMRTEAEYKTIFPTRTIPLLYSNRPILAHSPKGAFLTDFLEQHDCAEVVNEKSTAAIERGVKRLIEDHERRKVVVENAMQTAQLFDLRRVAAQLKATIHAA